MVQDRWVCKVGELHENTARRCGLAGRGAPPVSACCLSRCAPMPVLAPAQDHCTICGRFTYYMHLHGLIIRHPPYKRREAIALANMCCCRLVGQARHAHLLTSVCSTYRTPTTQSAGRPLPGFH